ncbi:MAG: TerC family protein [Microcystis sp.]|uniref:TerC family protein n=1 Tax=Microcystis sp. TaxID=1127 RepID=UPI003919192D
MAENLSLTTCGTILTLAVLETILSADNALALAALVRELPDPRQERQALNWGLAGAFVLRVAMLVSASWTVKFWQVEVLGAIYKHFGQKFRNIETEDQNFAPNLGIESLGSVIVLIAFTDLAFSLDSMTTAIALADRFWILLTGGILGMLALRFLTGLFVRWLAEFVYLQDAAYLTVLAVGGRLLLKACQPTYLPPEWMVLIMVAVSLSWGFSKGVVVE